MADTKSKDKDSSSASTTISPSPDKQAADSVDTMKQPSHSSKDSRRHAPYKKPVDAAPSEPLAASHRVYVGNLSWGSTWRDLKDHMTLHSTSTDNTTTVIAPLRADILHSYDGRSKGCGIVEYESAEEALQAVEDKNNSELGGRQIFVREDRETSHAVEGQTKRVYVGNLSWEVAWQDLKDHMRSAGEVQYSEVMTDVHGRSKGCGIVEFVSPEGAKEAIEKLTNTELKGRMIFVREDREQGSGGGRGGYSSYGGRGGQHHHNHHSHGAGGGLSVYVGNLAYETSWQDLKDHMRAAGNVDKADILKGEDGRSKGCGIVHFQKPAEAARAIRELQNTLLHGRPIFLREDRDQAPAAGGGYHSYNNRGGGAGNTGNHQHHQGNSSYMQGTPAEEGCQLFVGNLSWDAGWRELKDYFSQCGEVDRAEVAEGSDGRKRGFGLVRFHSAKDALVAIQKLNGVEFMGRPLDVKVDSKA